MINKLFRSRFWRKLFVIGSLSNTVNKLLIIIFWHLPTCNHQESFQNHDKVYWNSFLSSLGWTIGLLRRVWVIWYIHKFSSLPLHALANFFLRTCVQYAWYFFLCVTCFLLALWMTEFFSPVVVCMNVFFWYKYVCSNFFYKITYPSIFKWSTP